VVSPSATAGVPAKAQHPFDLNHTFCNVCHDITGGLQGGKATPADHQGRTNDGCKSCHESLASAATTTAIATSTPTQTATAVSGPFTITASAGSNGAIAPAGAVTVNSGAAQTFTITPATGYQISTLTVDGNGVTPASSYNFGNVRASHTISATFALISTATPTTTATATAVSGPFTITASAGSNGAIAPAGGVTVNSGGAQIFTITPAAGYRINTLTVDGVAAPPQNSYNFSNVTSSHTINVTFEPIPTVSPTSTGTTGVTLSINANSTAQAGGTLVVNVNVSAVTKLDLWQFYLRYDPSVLQVVGAETTGPGVTAGLIGSATAPVGVAGWVPPASPVTGSGAPPSYLAQVHFQVVGAAGRSSNITLSQVTLLDNLGNGITPVSVVGGAVQVTAP
jgi:hypothetical protein